MRKLKIDDEGQIFLDGVEIDKNSFNAEFLIKVFGYKMNGEIDFELSDKTSVSQIFKGIEESLKPESTFLTQYNTEKSKAENYKKELEQLTNMQEGTDKLN